MQNPELPEREDLKQEIIPFGLFYISSTQPFCLWHIQGMRAL